MNWLSRRALWLALSSAVLLGACGGEEDDDSLNGLNRDGGSASGGGRATGGGSATGGGWATGGGSASGGGSATGVQLEGFSQGGAMAFTLVCARPNVFRAAVVHSGGGLGLPKTCQPVAYFSSLGQQESSAGQTMTSDFFARSNGCTVETLPKAPSGGHLCTDYQGCSAGHPVRWCPYDGGHTASPADRGQSASWMPNEVWSFLSKF